jgi:RHS repeat-associated protein
MPHDLMPSELALEESDTEFLSASEPSFDVFGPSILSAMKKAGRSLLKRTRRTGTKGVVLAAMAAAGAGLATPAMACYTGCSCGGTPRSVTCGAQANGSTNNISGSASGGDPVNIATGNVFFHSTDYKTAGQNPLEFTRYYNSMGSTGTTYAVSLGTNWRSTYDRYIQTSYAGYGNVFAERADGQLVLFWQNGSLWSPTQTNTDYSLSQSGTTWTLTDHNDTVEVYNDLGTGKAQLASITLRNGYQQALSYSGGLLQSVTDSYGRSLNFNYSGGLLQSVTTPDTLALTYGYTATSGSNVLSSVSYNTSPATSQTYAYTNASYPFALTSVTDENGNNAASWTYDGSGRAATSQQGGSLAANLTTFSYPSSTTTTVKNPFGVIDTYTFTSPTGVGQVTSISRASTSSTPAMSESFVYDGNGYMDSSKDWNGDQTTTVNNSYGNPTTITEGVGSTVARTTTVSYDPTWVRLPHQIVTPGLTSTFSYDGNGNPLTRTDLDTTTNTVPYSTNGQTRVFTWTWDSTGQETSIQLPRTDLTVKTTFGYTGGALTSIEDALGHTTNIASYTGGGYPLTVYDQNSVETTLTWDDRLNLNSSTLHTTAGNLVTTWTHDPANRLTALQWPDNSKLTYGYDAANRLTTITDLPGNTINYTLDPLGDRTAANIKNASATLTWQDSATFDALGRKLTDTSGSGFTTDFTWDNNGNVLTVAPPTPSGTTTYTWDALNRPATRVDPSPGGTTTFTFDAHDKPLSVKDPNDNTTYYVNDGFSETTQVTSPDTGTSVYTWGRDRSLIKSVLNGGQTATYSYDADDRNISVTYPADSTLNIAKTYDQTGHGFGIGRLTSATDQAGSLSLTYDERANITNESRVVPSLGTLTTATAFDPASHISSITYPSGTVVAYARNTMGEVSGITATLPGASTASNVATSITYEPLGPANSLTFGNGITGAYGFDQAYRATTRADTIPGGAAVNSLTYGYYNNSSVLYATDSVHAANTQSFGYDALDRMTGALSGSGGYGQYYWTWDTNSNIATQDINSLTSNFAMTSGTNKLASVTTLGTVKNYNNDTNGNLTTVTQGGTTLDTFTYNAANQMATTNWSSGIYATFAYDLTGHRLEKAPTGYNPILYQFNRTGGELLSENDLHHGQVADYIYMDPGRDSRPIAEVTPTTTPALYFMHTDRLGTPQEVTNGSKSVVWSATYAPFGNTVSFSGSLTTQSLRLPGQEFDPESGLNHNGFRYYAGGLTRYIQSDPIGLAAGTNTYQYANANPWRWTDREGLSIGINPGNWLDPNFPGYGSVNTDCGLFMCPTFDGPTGPSVYCEALSEVCGTNPASPLLNSMRNGAGVGAATGAYAGFVSGEVLGGAETLGASGPLGGLLGGFVGGTVGAVGGFGKGVYKAVACSAANAYSSQCKPQ